MREQYSKDFGEFVKELAKDEHASPYDLLYCLKELSEIGKAIKERNLDEDDVNTVMNNSGITNEIIMKIIDKFLIHISKNIK